MLLLLVGNFRIMNGQDLLHVGHSPVGYLNSVSVDDFSEGVTWGNSKC